MRALEPGSAHQDLPEVLGRAAAVVGDLNLVGPAMGDLAGPGEIDPEFPAPPGRGVSREHELVVGVETVVGLLHEEAGPVAFVDLPWDGTPAVVGHRQRADIEPSCLGFRREKLSGQDDRLRPQRDAKTVVDLHPDAPFPPRDMPLCPVRCHWQGRQHCQQEFRLHARSLPRLRPRTALPSAMSLRLASRPLAKPSADL